MHAWMIVNLVGLATVRTFMNYHQFAKSQKRLDSLLLDRRDHHEKS
jgi:hypothetical protein